MLPSTTQPSKSKSPATQSKALSTVSNRTTSPFESKTSVVWKAELVSEKTAKFAVEAGGGGAVVGALGELLPPQAAASKRAPMAMLHALLAGINAG